MKKRYFDIILYKSNANIMCPTIVKVELKPEIDNNNYRFGLVTDFFCL